MDFSSKRADGENVDCWVRVDAGRGGVGCADVHACESWKDQVGVFSYVTSGWWGEELTSMDG